MAAHLVQLTVNVLKVMRFYERVMGNNAVALEDAEFVLKTLLTEVFVGDAKIRPWRKLAEVDLHGKVTIVGYSNVDAQRLKDLADRALPELASAFDFEAFFSRPVREFRKGDRYQIQVHFCPKKMVWIKDEVTNEKKKIERDVFHVDCDKREKLELPTQSKEEAYTEFFTKVIGAGADVKSSKVLEMGYSKSVRKGRDKRPTNVMVNSFCDFEAVVEITDGERFKQLLLNGIGRSRAYGNGMILVRAAA